MTPEFAYTLFYLLLCFCLIYPPTEFVSLGFTFSKMFSCYLGPEQNSFIRYHIKRVNLYLLLYSLLPFMYILIFFFLGLQREIIFIFWHNLTWKIFSTTSVALPLLALYQIKQWIDCNYEKHPIVQNLIKFCGSDTTWQNVALDIDREFRSYDKIIIQTSPITQVLVTENWILKVTPLNIFAAYQSDTRLSVKEANNYRISHQDSTETQYLNIEVICDRHNIDPFIIRINSNDFQDLQDRVTRTINIPSDVRFQINVTEQFLQIFKQTIKNNLTYNSEEILDPCIGCLQARPNIKLLKNCQNVSTNNCTTCYCRPMWCINCMGKWFASRQDPNEQSRWLSSKCSCPLCRATFCILDVCLLSDADV